MNDKKDITVKAEKKKFSISNYQHLFLPLSIVFMTVIISISMVISGRMLSDTLKQYPITLANAGTVAGATTTPAPTQAQTPMAITQDQLNAIFTGNSYIRFGTNDKKLLIVEIADPSCPYCHLAGGDDPELNKQVGSTFVMDTQGGSYIPPVRELRKLLNEGKASYAYIYMTGHGNGKLAMQALYCAYDQNKFWEVHDLLMNNAGYNLQNNDIKNDVAQAGKLADYLSPAIDKSYMQSCLESKKYENRVSTDEQFAISLGTSGTPGFFLNTTAFDGAVSYANMKSVVDPLIQ